ncbi:MAG TPA: GGDEF domain-containing protein [Thiobacillus sp.]
MNPPLISLRRRFVWFLAGVAGLFVAGMALSVVFSLHSGRAAEKRLLELEAAQVQSSVMRRWNDDQSVVESLARDPQLIALMARGHPQEIQQWAASRQALLPNTVGLALLNARGELYGDAEKLGVDSYCLNYLQQDVPGVLVPIHRNTPGREHVDRVAWIRDADGVVLGKLFFGVKLSQFLRVIQDSTQPGHAITLFDAAGISIASSGYLTGDVYETHAVLPAMGWSLKVQAPIPRLNAGGWLQILAGMLTLVGVLVFLVMVTSKMRRPILQDIQSGLDALACLTRHESVPPIETRYQEFAPVAADINRIAQQLHDQREQLAKLSLTDALTGLPNRRALETQFPHMQGLAERGHQVSLVSLDLDHFKSVNDQLGHAAGDTALIALADTFAALTRSSDMAYRLAGDEFIVLMCGLDNAGVMAWYQRLSDRFRSELRAKGLMLDNTLSAGQTWLLNQPGDTMDQALSRADQALYQAKARGRGQIVLEVGMHQDGAG